jgi:hypothetical protein
MSRLHEAAVVRQSPSTSRMASRTSYRILRRRYEAAQILESSVPCPKPHFSRAGMPQYQSAEPSERYDYRRFRVREPFRGPRGGFTTPFRGPDIERASRSFADLKQLPSRAVGEMRRRPARVGRHRSATRTAFAAPVVIDAWLSTSSHVGARGRHRRSLDRR